MRCFILVFFGLGLCMLQMGNAVVHIAVSGETEMMAEPDECEHKGCDCNCNCASPVPIYPLGGSRDTRYASTYAAPDEISNDYGHRPSYSGYSGGYSRPKCINRDCECECNCLYEAIPYNFQYTAREEVQLHGEREAMTSTTVLTAQQINTAPTAIIIPDKLTLPLNVMVVLDASQSSDPGGGPLSFDWTIPSGFDVLDNLDSPEKITIVATVSGDYQVRLFAIDEDGNVATSTATITVPPNRPPEAIIGLSSSIITLPDDTVTLDGSSSKDPDGDELTYEWEIISGPDGYDPILPAKSEIILTDLIAGEYTVALKVKDEPGNEAVSTVPIIVQQPPNSPPEAVIELSSPIITLPDNTVTLDGLSSSDSAGGIVSYEWDIISGPDGYDPILPAMSMLTLSDLIAGVYTVTLTVVDSTGLSDTALATITVQPPINRAPVAIIDPDTLEITLPTDMAVLDGSKSSDPDGDNLQFVWRIASAPDDYVNDPDLPLDESSLTLDGLIEGDYSIRLTVTDEEGLLGSNKATLTVLPKKYYRRNVWRRN